MASEPIDRTQLVALKSELFDLARQAVAQNGMPYASMIVDKRTGVVIAKDFNTTLETYDPSDQCSVASIRKALRALETADLSHTYNFSFFEPTVLSFDIALFAHITSFAWCVNATDAPDHYVIKEYSPTIAARDHPGSFQITPGFAREEAIELWHHLDTRIPKGFRLGDTPVNI